VIEGTKSENKFREKPEEYLELAAGLQGCAVGDRSNDQQLTQLLLSLWRENMLIRHPVLCV
jgi:hypothetical protein